MTKGLVFKIIIKLCFKLNKIEFTTYRVQNYINLTNFLNPSNDLRQIIFHNHYKTCLNEFYSSKPQVFCKIYKE